MKRKRDKLNDWVRLFIKKDVKIDNINKFYIYSNNPKINDIYYLTIGNNKFVEGFHIKYIYPNINMVFPFKKVK